MKKVWKLVNSKFMGLTRKSMELVNSKFGN
jgi:hypothetical protein